MFNVGSQELLVVFLLVFVLFGPRHIPEVARALGKGLGDLRRAIEGVEENVRRAGGDLPRFPRDLDDLVSDPRAGRREESGGRVAGGSVPPPSINPDPVGAATAPPGDPDPTRGGEGGRAT